VSARVVYVPSDDLSRVVDVINVGFFGTREVEGGVRALSVEKAMKTMITIVFVEADNLSRGVDGCSRTSNAVRWIDYCIVTGAVEKAKCVRAARGKPADNLSIIVDIVGDIKDALP